MRLAFLLNQVPFKIIYDQNGETDTKNYKNLWKILKREYYGSFNKPIWKLFISLG